MMTIRVAVDNDVLLKGTHFGLLDELEHLLANAGGAVVLGAAKYVVRDRLRKQLAGTDAEPAVAAFESFLAVVGTVEMSQAEQRLAAGFEELALKHGVEFDTGESALAAVVVTQSLRRLLTGDKRAVIALGVLREHDADVNAVAGRVSCFEQLLLALLEGLGADELRGRNCAAAFADKAAAVCFSCTAPTAALASIVEGLSSYINDVATRSNGVLATDLFEPEGS